MRLIFIAILLISALIGIPMYIDSNIKGLFESERGIDREGTIESKVLMDEYKHKEINKDALLLSGLYTGAIEAGSVTLNLKYYFKEDGTITKELDILGRYKMNGSAKYHFEGSTMQFSDVTGDLYLFPKVGDAVTLEGGHLHLIEIGSTGEIHSTKLTKTQDGRTKND